MWSESSDLSQLLITLQVVKTMLQAIIFLGFMIFFILFWRWILSNSQDYTSPPGRI